MQRRRFRDRHEYDLAPVYFIGLLNTEIQKSDRSDGSIWDDRFVSEYTFREKVSNEVVDETIFLNFVELHRFKKELHDCVSLVDKWCYSLKHVGSLDRLPEELRVRAFERLFEACEIAKFTPEEKLRYEHDMITERDYDNIIYTAKAEGLAEGEAKGKTDVARAMKAKGIEISLIAELTGLSEEEIQRL
ncbi:MAG: Rpn family recombination-promoting nuclease/putative transposase [Bacteroidetes bacterium]|uniref:Rpn family recombination-promoting nuclease/putative transposase n=1 Tax=Candidatus Cryptobacteroides excrementavium TaxID=2840759 RepID=A0A9D9J3V3_9BACT|nr:Rpn family recombination-promoting nuclease/putative transposase [Candidatus Cryptobacteroides excrementavium]